MPNVSLLLNVVSLLVFLFGGHIPPGTELRTLAAPLALMEYTNPFSPIIEYEFAELGTTVIVSPISLLVVWTCVSCTLEPLVLMKPLNGGKLGKSVLLAGT